MPKRTVNFTSGHFYHVFNGGANRKRIFLSDDNFRFLLHRLRQHTSKYDITVIAYCLMPNHYHFLLRQNNAATVSDCIQAVFNSYTKAFNKMTHRTGTLFEGRFRCRHIDREDYLIHVCRYIHRNPIEGRKPLVSRLQEWPYSNYPEWIGIRAGRLVSREFIEQYFENSEEYREFVEEDIEMKARVKEEFRSYLFD